MKKFVCSVCGYIHEMTRHGRGLEGLLKRYFK